MRPKRGGHLFRLGVVAHRFDEELADTCTFRERKLIRDRIEEGAARVPPLTVSTDASVTIDVLAKALFQYLEQLFEQCLRFPQIILEPANASFQRGGLASLVGNLTLLDEIPEESHGNSFLEQYEI